MQGTPLHWVAHSTLGRFCTSERVLYCALYCTVLRVLCTVLYLSVLYCTAHCTVLYCTVLYVFAPGISNSSRQLITDTTLH